MERHEALVEWLVCLARRLVPPRLERRYHQSPSFRRRVHRAVRWSWVPVLAYAFVFTDSGVASIVMRLVRIQTLRHEVATLERRQVWLRRTIDRREDDVETLERLARERCGMAFPGESVYRIVEITPAEARRVARQKRQIEKRRASDAAVDPEATLERPKPPSHDAR